MSTLAQNKAQNPNINTDLQGGLEAIEAKLEMMAEVKVGNIELEFASKQSLLHSRDPEILLRCAAIYEKHATEGSLSHAQELYRNVGFYDPTNAKARMGEARCMLKDPSANVATIVSLLKPVFNSVKDPVEMAILILPLYRKEPENKDLRDFLASKRLGEAVGKQSFFDSIGATLSRESSIRHQIQTISKMLRQGGGHGVIGFEGDDGRMGRSSVEKIVMLDRKPINRTTHKVARNRELSDSKT